MPFQSTQTVAQEHVRWTTKNIGDGTSAGAICHMDRNKVQHPTSQIYAACTDKHSHSYTRNEFTG